jgi:uncharacterized Zn finger protein
LQITWAGRYRIRAPGSRCLRAAARTQPEANKPKPFLLFQLRGLSREALHRELAKTPLGKALSAQLKADDQPPTPEPRPQRYPAAPLVPGESMDLHTFWHGCRLPDAVPEPPPAIPALLLRRAGDRPGFWHRDNAFIEAMSEVYRVLEGKNRERL